MPDTSGIKAGRAYVELGTNDKIAQGLKRAQRQLTTFATFAKSIGTGLIKSFAIPAAGFFISGRVFAQFDDRMRVVRAVTGATEQEFSSLREEAKRLGAETSFSARQVADAMAELGRAGFTPTQILASTEAVLALSRATDTELARATEIAGAALRGFNLDVSEMGRVTDVLTATANGSAQTLEDLFEAFKPVAPIAAEAGESIEQTAAAIAVLANNGIKGSLAGNALARAYKNLSDTSKQNELKKLGVDALDAQGNIRPLAVIINELAKATSGLGTGQKLSIFESLFGRGQAAALKLASSGKAFDDLVKNITDSAGSAQSAAEQMDAGVGGSIRKLLSATEAIGIAIGESIEKPLQKMTDRAAKVAAVIKYLITQNQKLIVTAFKITGAVLAAGVAFLGVGLLFSLTATAIGGFLSAIALIPAGFALISSAIGLILSPIGIATGAFAAFIALIASRSSVGANAIKFLGDTFKRLADFVGPAIEAISDAIQNGNIELAMKIVGKQMEVAWEKSLLSMEKSLANFQNKTAKTIVKFLPEFDLGVAAVKRDFQNIITEFKNISFSGPGIDPENATRIQNRKAEELDRIQREFDKKFTDYLNLKASPDDLNKFIDEQTSNKVNELNESLKKLEGELSSLIKTANGGLSGLSGNGSSSPTFGKLADLAELLKTQANSLASKTNSSVTGTFNPNALFGLSAASREAERTATATEKTAQNTSKVLKAIKEQPGAGRFA